MFHRKGKRVLLSMEEISALNAAIDLHLEGQVEALSGMIEDKATVETADQLLELAADVDAEIRLLTSVKDKINA